MCFKEPVSLPASTNGDSIVDADRTVELKMSLGRGVAPALVNKQFNSPIRLYSPESVQEALNKHTQALSNGAIG
jgi:hypothetical protein